MEVSPEQLATIEEVVNILAPNFRFAYYDTDDLKQEGRMFALEGLHKYDKTKASLKTFLIIYLRSQFLNLRRKKYYRYEPPCTCCPFFDKKKEGDLSCNAFTLRIECPKWNSWGARNDAKKSLAGTPDSTSEVEKVRDAFPLDVENKEIFNIIDKHLPLEMRGDFRRLVEGARLPKYRRTKLVEVLQEIVTEKCPDLVPFLGDPLSDE